jgi:hypothetical protein
MQLDALLGELIETADQFFIKSAFNFRTNLKGTQGNWRDHPYLEQFVEKLNPYLKHLERKLSNALPDRYPDKQIAICFIESPCLYNPASCTENVAEPGC